MSRQILNGWKEISSYINRSVRTVQRWEARLELPVYRPALKDRSAVMAFSDELDRWISRASPDMGEEDGVPNGNEGNDAFLLQVLDNVSAMVLDTAELSSQVQLLQDQLRQSLKLYRHAIASRTLIPGASAPGRGIGPVLTFRSPQRGLVADLPGMVDASERAPGHSSVEKAR
jgi:hypothetical protein